ncbi:MAG: hypothetical protein WCS87_03930 [Methylococcaceae bacterium]
MTTSTPYQRAIQELEKMPLSEMAGRWACSDGLDPELIGARLCEKQALLDVCVTDGTLKTYTGKDERLWVTLLELQAWARKNGNNPSFLFPEYNPIRLANQETQADTENIEHSTPPKQKTNDTGYSDTEISTMLKLILCMAIDGYRYDPSLERNTATGAGRQSIKRAIEKCSTTMDEKTIAKFLARAEIIHPDIKAPQTK